MCVSVCTCLCVYKINIQQIANFLKVKMVSLSQYMPHCSTHDMPSSIIMMKSQSFPVLLSVLHHLGKLHYCIHF